MLLHKFIFRGNDVQHVHVHSFEHLLGVRPVELHLADISVFDVDYGIVTDYFPNDERPGYDSSFAQLGLFGDGIYGLLSELIFLLAIWGVCKIHVHLLRLQV